MRAAFVNPSWTSGTDISFVCREPHCPLEVAGHGPLMLEGHLYRTAAGIIEGGRPLASNASEAACRHG
ncbi:MAG TPA: hypothetical protein VKA90_04615 [Beijerinckiaceae bacterium]|jgi:hypothetical protein|nr:hypothetical protein [Beijerinckiaceae bacterium]